ncbi:MAG TPA: 50S ribosomal protein L19 [Candidatus Saccharimonadales bacterium]|nr:50S ribosomal protein L19 [Candidatus Saccharimonadales bacterium]
MIQSIDFVPGDIVRVHQKIQEGEKTRIQIFQGTVLGIRGRGENKSFTVQKMVGDVAVERIWQIGSPMIEKVEVKAHAKRRVRRAQLTYLHKPKS